MRSYNVLVLGGGGVGKSAITRRYMYNVWNEVYDPTVEDSFTKILKTKTDDIQLEIVDTAGYDQFTGFSDILVNMADGFLIVMSKDSLESLQMASHILQAIKRGREGEYIPITVVCNKKDLSVGELQNSHISAFQKHVGLSVHGCSARVNEGIEESFNHLVTKMVSKYPNGAPAKVRKKKSTSWWRKVLQ